jgi:hypothetical protein
MEPYLGDAKLKRGDDRAEEDDASGAGGRSLVHTSMRIKHAVRFFILRWRACFVPLAEEVEEAEREATLEDGDWGGGGRRRTDMCGHNERGSVGEKRPQRE